jgi:guanylate kinase
MEDARPKLLHKQAFEKALHNYQVSEHARDVLARTSFVALMGLAGGGRNTVISRLVEEHDYFFLVSDTTRPPKFRDGRMEENGINYYFRDEVEMLHEIENGEFIEAEIIHNQQVSGTSIREVERAIATGRIPIHDFEFGGAHNVALANPDADIIGLLPPEYDEWLRRLQGRETMHAEEFANRLQTAKIVLERMLSEPYVKLVINDNLDQCVNDIRDIVEQENYMPETHAQRRQVAEALLARVTQALQ